MLGNTGDDLANMWGLITTGFAVGGLGMTLTNRLWRGLSLVVGLIFVLAGLAWAPIRHSAPFLETSVTAVMSNVQTWVLLVVILATSWWLRLWRNEMTAQIGVQIGPLAALRANLEQEIAAIEQSLAERIEKVEAALEAKKPDPARPEIDWRPWKHRREYSIYEFAKILSGTDPAKQALTTNGSAYARLLLEDAQQGALKYTPERVLNEWNGREFPKPADYDTKVPREAALAWAAVKGFPVDHIK